MFSVRRATAGDVGFVKGLELEARLSGWTEADYLLEISRPDSLFYIVQEEEIPVGFILARLIMYKQKGFPQKEIEIYNLAVKPDFRKRKAGTKLLEKIFQIGKENSVGQITLEVRESNLGAISFYKNKLFKTLGKRKNFYSHPTENAVLMVRELK